MLTCIPASLLLCFSQRSLTVVQTMFISLSRTGRKCIDVLMPMNLHWVFIVEANDRI